jgi:GNAT superfamily N-acetyltransferase
VGGADERQDCGVSIVRVAVPNDADGIGEAHAEAWRVAYAGLFPADQLEVAVEVRRRMWVGLVGDPALGGTLLVAEKEGVVIGFIHFGATSEDHRTAEVYGFYVHPSAWGTGTAQALMGRALASVSEVIHRAILWTHQDAQRARSFYAKSGWTATGDQRRVTTWDGLDYSAVEYARVLE